MALADTGTAIGKVTELLVDRLESLTSLSVGEGRPEPPANGHSDRQLNLFLYEAAFDPSLKNVPLEQGQQEPLWLVLKYLLTPFDAEGYSDTIGAHENLGIGLRALQEMNILTMANVVDTSILRALGANPEPLKITFEETPSELLGRLMQGADEKYRFSIGFQVRPVMIASPEPPVYPFLVGVDYTQSPPVTYGEEGVHIAVFQAREPRISHISPSKIRVGEMFTIHGSNLNTENVSIRLGSFEIPPTQANSSTLNCLIEETAAAGSTLTAGDQPVRVVLANSGRRDRLSNPVIGTVIPALRSVTVSDLHQATGTNGSIIVYGTLEFAGFLPTGEYADMYVGLVQDGRVIRLLDDNFETDISSLPGEAPQSIIRLQMMARDAVPAGEYRVILRINGTQAPESPTISMVMP